MDRKKWTTNSKNLENGDLVETYLGVDGVVRSVKVRTPNSKFVRPTASLCLLEAVS